MRKHQTGEVILVMMAVMLVGSGHMGMGKMEEDSVHAEQSGSSKPQTKAEPLSTSASKGSAETQNLRSWQAMLQLRERKC